MNLKLVVASMSILGLVSCPVFAATDAKAKHPSHHHKAKHHRTVHHETYKGMEMPAKPAVEVCAVSQETMLLRGMTQNMGRAIPNPCYADWFKRVLLAGGMAVDLGKWGNRENFMGENYQRFSINDAYFNLQAQVNDWVHAFASISYNTATMRDPYSESRADSHVAEFDAAYSNNVISGSSSALQLEQAFATFGNFSMSPVFLQIGKQFQDFGRYEIHPITESMTQVMSKTLATSLKLGFIADGFNGSVYGFDEPIGKVGKSKRETNYGAALGYDMPSDSFGFNLGVGYLYNLMGVNDIAYNVGQFGRWNNTVSNMTADYHKRVAGVAAYADFNSGPFVLNLRYTTALDRFNVNDLPKNGTSDLNVLYEFDENRVAQPVNGNPKEDAKGAKPWAAGINVGYGFDAWCQNQNIYLGYQTSRETAGLLLPKYRWVAGYGMDVVKWTTLTLEWDHDKAFNSHNGGNGKTTNLVTLRAAVKFG